MTGILASVENLVSSILGVFTSLFGALFSGIQGVVAMVVTLVGNVGSLVGDTVSFLLGTYLAFPFAARSTRRIGVFRNGAWNGVG
jgi:membrane protein DedA with SNARE-associated domain